MPRQVGGAASLAAAIGKTGWLRTREERFKIKVKVLDARRVYGRVEFLVTPVGGEGKAWTAAKRIRLD